MKKVLTLAVAAALASGAAMTHAYEAGDWILRAGAVTVAPDTDSDAISIPTSPPTVLPNGVDVDDDTQLSIIGTYMATPHWGIELLAATPFTHDITLEDAPIDAGETTHLPPTLTVQWYPRGGKDGWQPYVGIGLNYTWFYDSDADRELHNALEGILGAELRKTELDLDDSFGLSASAGVDIPFGEHWAFNAGVWYIDIDTTAEVKVYPEAGGSAKVKFDVDVDPWVYNIGIAYKF
jgi:outer membrane protein